MLLGAQNISEYFCKNKQEAVNSGYLWIVTAGPQGLRKRIEHFTAGICFSVI